MGKFNWYIYTLCVWCMNLLLILLSWFVRIPGLLLLILVPAVMISFAGTIFASRPRQGKGASWGGYEHMDSRFTQIAGISFLYAFINFIICMYFLRDGGPHIHNGVYCLWNHGFIREITKAEYDALAKVERRFIVGHMLIFSGLPAAFFSARKESKKQ